MRIYLCSVYMFSVCLVVCMIALYVHMRNLIIEKVLLKIVWLGSV